MDLQCPILLREHCHFTGHKTLALWCLDTPPCGRFKAVSALQAPSTQPDPFPISDLWQPGCAVHQNQPLDPTPQKSGLLTAINTLVFQTWTLGILWILSLSPPAWSCTPCLDTAACDLSPCYLLTFFPELCSFSVPSRLDPTRSVVILYPHLLQSSSVYLNEVQCQFILLWLVPLVLSLRSHCQTYKL